jgi:uncharacterized UPF0146 family protein
MGSYKHIETCIGEYIAKHYTNTVEVGIGENTEAARILRDAGARVRCTDVKDNTVPEWLCFTIDDVFSPEISLYKGADLIYAIRPAIEMIPPLLATVILSSITWALNPMVTAVKKLTAVSSSTAILRHQNPSNSVD